MIYNVLKLVLFQAHGIGMTPIYYGPRRLRSECLYQFRFYLIRNDENSNRRHPKADEQMSLPTFPSQRIILFNGNKGIDPIGRSILRSDLFRSEGSQVGESGGNEVVGHQVLPKGHDIIYCERNF